ncbi:MULTISPECIES: PRC-barrel domain-containing protein [Roseomonadaceae]|uniref:PRC-barrel domain-containing protein n=1 Tax=Falsiroseomonas oleicola TaxID=2801474 RepID=A0ABS6H3Y2_9PROT|nr:PRC-barrel domain-containing protein [Roseomonas oleicola]MBU8542547.1 PRC-barrel domain-containing protein [Roseomonas oleicola]
MQTNRTNRPNLLATTATVAALALMFAGGAQAQTAPATPSPMAQPGQTTQPQAGQTREARPQATSTEMQQATQELRVARQQIGDASEDVSPQALARARQAVERLSRAQAGTQAGPNATTSSHGLQQQVTQARQTLRNDDVPAQEARRAIDRVLAAVPSTARDANARETGTGASAMPAPAQSGGSQPQTAAARSPAAGMELSRVSNVVGTNVIGREGRDAGEIENLLIDGSGQVRAAVIEWGGFFGLGARRAVVPMDQLTLGGEDDRVRMDLTREQLEQLPRYDADRLEEYGRTGGWGDGTRTLR